ncbi:MAG: hypothetical protein AABY95_04205 [Pseudomonadota bacterium]
MRKIIALALLIFGLLLGWTEIRALTAETYRHKSQVIAKQSPTSIAALKSAVLSVQLAPWNAYSHAELAWRLQSSGNFRASRQQFAQALSWAPADAYLWAEYAQLLAHQRKFGREMELVTRESNRLGPTSSAIQHSNAYIGLYFWGRGTQELRNQWQTSMAFVLRTNRKRFLEQVRNVHRDRYFCLGPGVNLQVGSWCDRLSDSP